MFWYKVHFKMTKKNGNHQVIFPALKDLKFRKSSKMCTMIKITDLQVFMSD